MIHYFCLFLILCTHVSPVLCSRAVVRGIICGVPGGGGGEVHVRLAAAVKLQPSVVSDNGRLISGGGG